MPSTWGADLVCVCGARYTDHKTEHTFASVRRMMKTGSDDTSTWVYKRRGGVLGYWHELKVESWNLHVAACWNAAPDELVGDRPLRSALAVRPLKGQPAPPRAYQGRQGRRSKGAAGGRGRAGTRADGPPGLRHAA